MSQYGYPGSGNPQGQAPTSYPTQSGYPQVQKPGVGAAPQQATYPTQGQVPANPVPAPRTQAGVGQSCTPYPQPGQAPYPPPGHPYPQQGQALYPQQGQAPYPQQGQASYPQQGQAPYPQQGQTPYPQQGQTPYPQQGPAPYPLGQTTYPQQGPLPNPQQGQPSNSPGQATYPQRGPAPNPPQGQAPLPTQSQAPYPQQGPAPYPQQGPALNPQQGQAPYPQQGQAPYPQQGPALNPQQGPAPYPQGQTPYPQQGPALNPQQGPAPYPQGPAPYPQGQGHVAAPGVTPSGPSSTPFPGQTGPVPVGQPGQAPYPAQGQPQQGPYPSTGPGQPGGPALYPSQAQSGQGSVYGHPSQAYPGQQPPPSVGSQATQAVGGRVVRPGTDQFKSRVEIRIECKNLLNLDVMSKSDPCAVMSLMRGGRWEEVGRTENVKNCLSPKFSRSFVVNYFFEEVQKVLISVYDIDNATPQLNDDDFLGQIETTLGQLVSNSPLTAPLMHKTGGRKAGQGTITIRTEEIKEGMENVLMTFRAQKLDSKDLFGKSDPYLEILKATSDGNWQVIHRTEVIKNNLNPTWRAFQLSLQNLCGGNKQQSIKFDCYDWDSDGAHDYIGGFTTTFDEMSKAMKQEISWPCVNPSKKAKKRNYSNSGIIYLTSLKVVKEYSFLDYIMGGTQINFTVGIDFTASNGNPTQSSSLHYINPHQPNEYMAAIKSVGEVCQDYDTDKLFPALGFGAKIPPNWEVSHEFAINFNPQNPYCQGIDGVLQAYYNCIRNVQLYGPTNAAPIINHVAKFAVAAQSEEPAKGAHAYFILLLLTDGVLSDMSNTKAAIVQASRLPMSLIIVGVGQADFSDMQILDGDNGVLRAPNGEAAKRDIVQFVPIRDFKHTNPPELARHVLAEVPKQVTDYYKMRGMQPNTKPAQQMA